MEMPSLCALIAITAFSSLSPCGFSTMLEKLRKSRKMFSSSFIGRREDLTPPEAHLKCGCCSSPITGASIGGTIFCHENCLPLCCFFLRRQGHGVAQTFQA